MLIGLLLFFSLPLSVLLFLNSKNTRNELARPVMGTIFLVIIVIVVLVHLGWHKVFICWKKLFKRHDRLNNHKFLSCSYDIACTLFRHLQVIMFKIFEV